MSAIPKANACLVVDINLPEMSGTELCSALAASGRGLPVVLITGSDDSTTHRLIGKAHPVAALFKPVNERALFDATRVHLLVPIDDSDDQLHVPSKT